MIRYATITHQRLCNPDHKFRTNATITITWDQLSETSGATCE